MLVHMGESNAPELEMLASEGTDPLVEHTVVPYCQVWHNVLWVI